MSETDSAFPFLKFFPQDHIGDPGLKLSSLGARGLWMDMLCLMYAGEPHGYLCRSGKPLTIPQLARLVGSTDDEAARYLDELRCNGVFSEDDVGIFSRRMLRDAVKRERYIANGRLGGNPQLVRRVKREVKPEDITQKPRTRVQKLRSNTPDDKVKAPSSAADRNSSAVNVASDLNGFREATDLARDVVALLDASLSNSEREGATATTHRWIARGWHPEIIKATIRSVRAREGSAGQIRPLAYYEPALADAHKPAGR